MNEYEIEEIKREIVESRALTIKTNNLVNALAADLKSISKRQQGAERKVVLNSATAYVVTIAVLLVFVKLTWDIRLETVRAENKETRDQLDAVQKDIKVDQEREEAQKRASRQAGEFYQLIVQSKRQELIAAYPDVVKLDLTPTERAVFDAAHSPQANLQLSRALIQLGLHRDAIPILMQLSEASADKEVMDEATLQLAEAELAIPAWNDAKTTLRAFIRRFPNSPHINDARGKLAEVSLYH